MTLPFPGSVCDTKWNSSAVPVMSAPPALIVHLPVLLLYDWLPGGMGPPMSAQVHGVGHVTATLVPVAKGMVPVPIRRHAMDSLCEGEQVPGSIPPVSSTCVLSARVVDFPPIVTLTVGATVIGWGGQALGYPLVSKLS